MITIDSAFSDEAIRGAVNKWLKDRGYGFEVRMIPFEKAKGSGMLKKLKEQEQKTGHAIPFETLKKQLDEDQVKEMVNFIELRKDRKKVFYHKGFYGSLVPDLENDRLTGKIEGIGRLIVYEGKTVRGCEQRFIEAV